MNLDFVCRKQFKPFFESPKRWALIVAHRRCGKTVACIQRVIIKALEEGKPDGRYGYIAPFREQAKTVAWEYLKRFSEPVVASVDDFRESDLQVKLVTGQTIRLFGADNPNALRGTYFDGVVLDEYADMKPSLWGEVIRPTLSDRHGWATFIGTPRGRNAFFDQFEQAGSDPEWFRLVLKASETGLLAETELADARKTMSANQYDQEYECSFDAAVIGAVYAKELKICRDSGRVRSVPYDGAKLVFTAFDIGRRDATAIWWYQIVSGEVRVLEYFEDNMEAAPYYASVLKSKNYRYDTIYLPHDADNETAATDLTFASVMRTAGFRIQVLPKLGLEDGINATRMLFPKMVFDADKCQAGLEALQNYRWGYNERMGGRKAEPVHDWCFAAHTQVLTPSGWREIQDISVHDQVLTPCGTRAILRSGIVRITDKWTMTRGIRSTLEHRFFTSRGLVMAADLQPSDRFWTRDSWGLTTLGWLCAALRFGFMGAITSATREGNRASVPCSYTGWYMRLCAAKFRQAMKSITSMMTRSITIQTTLLPCRSLCIAASTSQSLDISAYARSVDQLSAVTKHSAQGAVQLASGQITPELSESAAPAYSLTVDIDECYFVRGCDGRSYLVSNSSHGADAARYMAQSVRIGSEDRPKYKPIQYQKRSYA